MRTALLPTSLNDVKEPLSHSCLSVSVSFCSPPCRLFQSPLLVLSSSCCFLTVLEGLCVCLSSCSLSCLNMVIPASVCVYTAYSALQWRRRERWRETNPSQSNSQCRAVSLSSLLTCFLSSFFLLYLPLFCPSVREQLFLVQSREMLKHPVNESDSCCKPPRFFWTIKIEQACLLR